MNANNGFPSEDRPALATPQTESETRLKPSTSSEISESSLAGFSNPNYGLEVAAPSNDELYLKLYEELSASDQKNDVKTTTVNRKNYAFFNLDSMGVVLDAVQTEASDETNRSTSNQSSPDATQITKNYPIQSTPFDPDKDLESNGENGTPDSGINEEDSRNNLKQQMEESSEEPQLAPGWEKHCDEDGPYYWHIKSGTIQREQPAISSHQLNSKEYIEHSKSTCFVNPRNNSATDSETSQSLDEIQQQTDLAAKRKSYPGAGGLDDSGRSRPIRFAVSSLGWLEISEDDLTPEKSSKAVNKCIVDLSLGRNDILDVVGRWGDGKDLYMDIDEQSLQLVEPEKFVILNSQPIHTIRVWGVGRDNCKDFAYVARDRVTKKYMCHVFRCDTSARIIANTLRDICKHIMWERTLAQQQQQLNNQYNNESGSVSTGSGHPVRPNNLPMEHRRHLHMMSNSYSMQSFPTPMEEPKKNVKVTYIGSAPVTTPTGMGVLNSAIENLQNSIPQEQWKSVNVAIAPSTITITEQDEDGMTLLLAECRVRYLSFLGIGKDVRTCAFIVHTAEDQFVAHAFYCEPSSGALCKTIEAACKLRYQKCLDAHPDRRGGGAATALASVGGGKIGTAIKNMIGNITTKIGSKNS